MPSRLCEHVENDLRVPDLLRSEAHQRRGVPQRLDERRRWLLPQEIGTLWYDWGLNGLRIYTLVGTCLMMVGRSLVSDGKEDS